MGKGNVSVRGPYEAVYCISNEFLHVYREDEPDKEEPEVRLLKDIPYSELDTCRWLFDEEGSSNEEEDVLECIVDALTSLAVELLQKEVQYDDRLLGFQKRHFERYKEALKAAMLERVPEITFPTSAWTSGTIRAEDIAK